jgi:site-specific DNA-methyltransferase (adenine-specific)
MLKINEIYNGDCLEVMKDIDDKSIDMILCDLPYGTTACKWDTIIPFEPLWEQYKRIIKDNGAIVLTASQPFTSALVMSNVKMFKYEWIWEKERPTNSLLCKKQPPKYHENICIFYQKQPIFNVTKVLRKEENKRNNKIRNYKDNTKIDTEKYGERVLSGSNDYIYASNILRIPMQRGLHPTQKPLALFEYLIKTYTNEGDLVLDNCAGSGTTGVACENINRNYILIEKEKEYYEIGKNRIIDNRRKMKCKLFLK